MKRRGKRETERWGGSEAEKQSDGQTEIWRDRKAKRQIVGEIERKI
jgi:hypothetical protein